MSYIKFYQKQYRLKNKDRIRGLQKELYNDYKEHYLPCIFCSKLVQLNGALLHLKTAKCKCMQSVNNYDELLIEYKKINELRSSIRLNDDAIE